MYLSLKLYIYIDYKTGSDIQEVITSGQFLEKFIKAHSITKASHFGSFLTDIEQYLYAVT